MIQESTVGDSRRELASTPGSYTLFCGCATLYQFIPIYLAAKHLVQTSNGAATVIVDAPRGFALHQLRQTRGTDTPLIVTTTNACPEYWEDIWAFQPAILLASGELHAELADAIERAARGERYRRTPAIDTCLTQTERMLLRYVAQGWSSDRIAAARGIQPKTVSNAVSIVCQKLRLPDRTALALYYWGHRELLS